MTHYKSLYEMYLAELNEQGNIEQFSPEENMRILEELNEGMEDFINDQKVKERCSELELAGIVLI
jgi:hypothetical protein